MYSGSPTLLCLLTFCSFSKFLSPKQSPVHFTNAKCCCTEAQRGQWDKKLTLMTSEQVKNVRIIFQSAFWSLWASVVQGSQFLLKGLWWVFFVPLEDSRWFPFLHFSPHVTTAHIWSIERQLIHVNDYTLSHRAPLNNSLPAQSVIMLMVLRS